MKRLKPWQYYIGTSGWHIYHWREQARLLLSTVINGNNPEAKQTAIDIINRLGARGFLEFMDLIK